MTITHDYFGTITLNSYDLWGKEMTLNGRPVAVYLSADSDNLDNLTITQDTLDKCATICQTIEQFDQQNREFLLEFLNKDSEFVDYYLDEQEHFAESETLSQFYQGDKTVASFVDLLQAMQINIILKDTKSLVASDYMIEPSESDQILCVYRKLNGDLMDIASES